MDSIKWKGERTGILEMRRHYHSYFKGFPDFKPLREILVTSLELPELLETLNQVEKQYADISAMAEA
jgi:tRNA-dihydrouridine synthase